jgi:hypothetical protein
MRLFLTLITTSAALVLSGCEVAEAERVDDDRFPLEPHSLWPIMPGPDTQVAAGRVVGPEGSPDQPIPFSHKLHAGELAMNCQFCHNEARNSIHGGVPPVQTCMNCHQHIKTNNPNVQLIHMAYCGEPKCTVVTDEFGLPVPPAKGQAIPWNKVHDLPDYVNFAHNRHVRAGVSCTECHGQVQLQGDYVWETQMVNGEPMQVRAVKSVMVRESTLQMGWCLDCHASHPSVEQNYGDGSDLRRAELKDCWTCHK